MLPRHRPSPACMYMHVFRWHMGWGLEKGGGGGVGPTCVGKEAKVGVEIDGPGI